MDVARGGLYLLSDEGAYVIGVYLRVDGGNGAMIGTITAEDDQARPH